MNSTHPAAGSARVASSPTRLSPAAREATSVAACALPAASSVAVREAAAVALKTASCSVRARRGGWCWEPGAAGLEAGASQLGMARPCRRRRPCPAHLDCVSLGARPPWGGSVQPIRGEHLATIPWCPASPRTCAAFCLARAATRCALTPRAGRAGRAARPNTLARRGVAERAAMVPAGRARGGGSGETVADCSRPGGARAQPTREILSREMCCCGCCEGCAPSGPFPRGPPPPALCARACASQQHLGC